MDSRMHWAPLMALTMAALLVVSTTAQAQGPRARKTIAESQRRSPNERTQGLMLGVHTIAAPGLDFTVEEFEAPFKTKFGMGAGLMIGYGFNRTFSSYVSFDVAKQPTGDEDVSGTFGLGHIEIGIRANLPNVRLGSGNTVPYVSGSFGRRALAAKVTDLESEESVDLAFHGQSFGLGAGVEHLLSPNVSFDGGLQLGFGKFDRFSLDGDDTPVTTNGATSIRLRLGVTWRP